MGELRTRASPQSRAGFKQRPSRGLIAARESVYRMLGLVAGVERPAEVPQFLRGGALDFIAQAVAYAGIQMRIFLL